MRIPVRLLFSLFAAGLVLLVGYLPGLTGALYYDDYSNLENLTEVVDFATAREFVTGGHAGPLGRPIALLSFLPFAEGWPGNTELILAGNLTIHLVNFYLVYIFGVLFLKRTGYLASSNSHAVALVAAFLWGVLPLLASTTLIVIQRMTGLSAMFGLLGLIFFIYGYRWVDRSPLIGVVAQLSVLGVGTVLAVLTKESGALIPIFALLVDFYCRDRSNDGSRPIIFRRWVLAILSLIVVYQISPFQIDYLEYSEFRGFSPIERLATQSVILWEYLFRAFVPQQPTAFGPFHDYYGIRELGTIVALAAAGWLLLIVSAYILRRKIPLFLFAMVWFFIGHLLESTVVMLELYFEHRNYLAMYGLCLFIVFCVHKLSIKFGRMVWAGFALYLLVMWAVLLMMTSNWGDKALAAETWAIKHPGSARAALHAVFVELGAAPGGDEYQGNQQFLRREKQDYALRVLDRTMGVCPDCIDIRLQALVFACQLDRKEEQRPRLNSIHVIGGAGLVTPSAISLVYDMVKAVSEGTCTEISAVDMEKLFSILRQNPALKFPVYSGKLYFAQAMMAEAEEDWPAVKNILNKGAKASPNALPILQYQIYTAIQSRDVDYGLAALAFRRSQWDQVKKDANKDLLRTLAQQLEPGKSNYQNRVAN